MSSSRSSSPSTIPLKFRRKSSSASTSVSLDDHTYGREDTAFTSPLPSSSPPLTPLHGTGGYEYPQWDHPKYLDDVGTVSYDQEDGFATLPWSCYAQDEKTSIAPHPLPSLMTKFAARVLKNQTLSSFQSPLYAACRTTSYYYPDGESAIADDCEEHDLESMDIHVRETYFATSSERGRWLSSPIATRVRTQAVSPRHGKSSPVKTAVDTSPSAARVRRRFSSPLADKELSSSSSSDDHDEDVGLSSPLPPSSLSSPMSNLSFLPDACEDDKIAESCPPLSNPYSCLSLGASDLNISPIAHTTPVGSTCLLSQFETPDMVPGPKPSNSADVSRSSSSCPGHVSMSIDVRVVSPSPPDATGSGADAMLSSPLSMFDDLPLAEPVIPLSNEKNTPRAGQPASTPDRMMNIAFGTASSCMDGALALSLLVDAKHETPDTIGKPSPINGGTKKRTKSPTSRSDAPRKKKRAIVQLPTILSDLREEEQERRALAKGKEKESHVLDTPEPPRKKSKSSARSCHSDDRRTKSSQRRKTLNTSEPHSRPAMEVDCTAFRPPDSTTSGAAHTSLGPVDPAEAEFHASLTGMLIEALAASRATSMDSSALYLAVTQTHPHLANERPKQEFQVLIAAVLESGRAQCGMFEKVDSSGGSRRKALESRWFYVPDRDEDRERASLISAIMPRQKRSETKKYKQYYYRPLGKISRWDPEDAP